MITNRASLPQVFVDILTPTDYDPFGASDYSATSLIDPPRLVQLRKRHKKEVSSDLLDLWYVWRGNCVHKEIEHVLKSNPKYLVERKCTSFEKPEGYPEDKYRRVVAKFDAYDKDTKTLYDHKTASSFIYGSEGKKEWLDQLTINAYFLEKEGYPVEKLAINCVFMDWREQTGAYKSDPDKYPPTPFHTFTFPCPSKAEQERFFKERLKLHVDAESLSDNDLPLCTDLERWSKGEKWAVYKLGSTRATKLCDTKDEAQAYILANKLSLQYKIEHRPATCVRCEKFCDMRDFCNQYQTLRKAA